MGDTAPPSSFLVLQVPDLEYLDSLESSEEFNKIDNLETVFHQVQEVAGGVGENETHILLNESCRRLVFPSILRKGHQALCKAFLRMKKI